MRLLIANRGEIARRIIGTAHRLGHETVAAFADPDEAAPFVAEATMATRLGPADLAQSYLSPSALLAAAHRTGATAVHPGYGFVAENASFAGAVVDSGLVWIGPHAAAIERMGSKIEARRVAAAAGVPVIPGFDESQVDAELADAAERIGFPVLIKAAAGGGGKGIRRVHRSEGFAGALAEARNEADRAFGDDHVIVERYVERPRHIEVQVVGDKHGGVVELGTRECSVQRRYQKILEEAPAPNLPDRTRSGLRTAATEFARSIGYDSAGTVEFVVDDESGDYFFLEMNTRLQVEHPVTEAVTGVDLVELQIRAAMGEQLPIGDGGVSFSGHAFEARINAEDASDGFAPQTGTITHLRVPDHARWDSGIELHSRITPHYDLMVAKLVVHDSDRAAALGGLRRALDELIVGGVVTTAGFHRWLVDQDPVIEGRVTTRFLDEAELPSPVDPEPAARIAAPAWCRTRDRARPPSAWGALSGFRTTPHRGVRVVALIDDRGELHDVDLESQVPISSPSAPVSVDLAARSVAVNVAGHTHTFSVPSRSERWAPSAAEGHGHAGVIVAPFPAVVIDVATKAGDSVAGGDVLLVIEAMKMLHSLTATGPGVVAEVRVAEGDQIESDQILVVFQHPDDTPTETGGGP